MVALLADSTGGYLVPAPVVAVDLAERKTCSNCKHYNPVAEWWGECVASVPRLNITRASNDADGCDSFEQKTTH